MPEDVVPQVEQEPKSDGEGPSFEQFSKDRKAGTVDATAGGDEHSVGGDQWDGNKWVNKTPRNEQGRFAKVRESLERSQKRSTYVKAVLEGTVDPDEHTMDADTWAAARNAQIARGTNKITPPEFPAEKTGDEAEGADAQALELTPAEIAHNSAHEDLNVRLLARYETPEVKQLTSAMEYAAQRGATPYFFDQLGHIAADHENREAVLLHLGQNPEKLAAYSHLAPVQLKNVVQVLSQQLGAQQKPTAPPKPKPPDPVGARAATTAFDVNDESLDADTWARQRNESLAKRGRRN